MTEEGSGGWGVGVEGGLELVMVGRSCRGVVEIDEGKTERYWRNEIRGKCVWFDGFRSSKDTQ